MNLKNQQPVFVPFKFRAEMEKLSKAALMDMVWDYAFEMEGEVPDDAMAEFRRRWEIVKAYRERAKGTEQ
jgi:hypothetical protein